jgi:hypothetical protein
LGLALCCHSCLPRVTCVPQFKTDLSQNRLGTDKGLDEAKARVWTW